MRIVVCDNHVPFVDGGGERLRRSLVSALRHRGHEVEIVAVPYKWYPPEQIERHMTAWRLLDFTEAMGHEIDRVIALRFPAYLARHPAKVVWLMHQHRTAYELWGTPYGDLEHFPDGARVRDLVARADGRFLQEAERLFAISGTVAARLHRNNSLEAEVLRPPVPRAERFRCGDSGDYVLYAARLERLKRHDLLVRAMAQVKAPVRCLLAGRGPEEPRLRRLIAELGLKERVRLLGHLPDDELVSLYADALALCYPAFDEDYGYGPLEAWLSGKPVITTGDGGEPAELVAHAKGGLVVPPSPQALARAIDRLADDRQLAARLGTAGHRKVAGLDLSWDLVVEKLLT